MTLLENRILTHTNITACTVNYSRNLNDKPYGLHFLISFKPFLEVMEIHNKFTV
jgi:hypothetical protein